MSFTKTISTVAALASIFGAGAAGWKLAQDNPQPNVYDERIKELEEKLKQSQQPVLTAPQPTVLLPTQTQVQQIPQEPQLPPPTTPPVTNETL